MHAEDPISVCVPACVPLCGPQGFFAGLRALPQVACMAVRMMHTHKEAAAQSVLTAHRLSFATPGRPGVAWLLLDKYLHND